MLRIKHKVGECVGCRHCADTAPHYFKMDDDGIAQLINSTQEGVFQCGEGFEEDIEELKKSEEGCPVNIIHVDK